MGILYLDETGNTGLKDTDQRYLIYGGPYLKPAKWKKVESETSELLKTYLALILSRIDQIKDPANVGTLLADVKFLNEFHFHASRIANRKQLWSKLLPQENEHFELLNKIIDVLIDNEIPVFVGILNKENFSEEDSGNEYSCLLDSYFSYVDSEVENFMVIWDDGDVSERSFIINALKNDSLSNCIPELVSAKRLPMLQLADTVLWIIQSYLKKDKIKIETKRMEIENLYQKLEPILKVRKVGF